MQTTSSNRNWLIGTRQVSHSSDALVGWWMLESATVVSLDMAPAQFVNEKSGQTAVLSVIREPCDRDH